MQLEHLQTFLAVHRLRNISHAARHLHVSQPAVSAHVKALESELGRPLFVRLPRGVVPTAAADALAQVIGDPLDTLAAAATSFAAGAPAAVGTLVVGGPADLLAVKIVPALAALTARGLRLRVVTGLTKPLVSRLAAGELDLVVATAPVRHRGVTLGRLFDEKLVLVAGGGWVDRLMPGVIDRVGPAALAEVPLVAFAEDAPLVRRYWRECFGSPPPAPAIVFDDLRAIAAAVASGAGFSVLPHYIVDELVRDGDATVLHQPVVTPVNTLYLATVADHRTRPGIAATIAHLSRHATRW